MTLLSDGLLLPTQATTIHNLEKSSKKSVEYLLMALGLASERTLQNYLQFHFGVDSITDPFEPPVPNAVEMISKSSAAKSQIIPQKIESGSLYVLAVPPINPSTIERISKQTGLMVVPSVITELRYRYLLAAVYGVPMDPEEAQMAINVLEGADPHHSLFGEPEMAIYDPFSGPIPNYIEDDPLDIYKLPVMDSETSIFDEFKDDSNMLLDEAIPGFTDEQRPQLLRNEQSGIFSHALSRYNALDFDEITTALSMVQSRDDLPSIFYSFASHSMRTASLLTCADEFAMGWTGAGLGLLPQRLEGIIVPENHGTFIAQIVENGVYAGKIEQTTVNKRLLALMGGDPEDIILGGVVTISDRPVIIAVFVVDDDTDLEEDTEILKELCNLMSSCLIRLIRKRKKTTH
ncbi:hypothetical protein KKF84_20910 [Myxococcota bacterium]|nr:hypothetical protein [Myxococcota bacterium]